MYKYGVRIQSVQRTCIIVGDNRREIRSDFVWFSFRIKKKKLCEKDGTEWLRLSKIMGLRR